TRAVAGARERRGAARRDRNDGPQVRRYARPLRRPLRAVGHARLSGRSFYCFATSRHPITDEAMREDDAARRALALGAPPAAKPKRDTSRDLPRGRSLSANTIDR